ncbi:ATP-binding protein [uncultured Maricaulis sp.]|uniref:AAA family ATPase n=1 Tax=uncultured Maricaulis sp. TaxID=174710 RepID=UPI0030DDAFFA|tara:strand:+ start:60456 stop:60971 length:516 start_codon:yes stop_codon:yes gene_type:complete
MTSHLHLVCGKIAAGKSTLCARLAEADATVLLSEDAWLSSLWPGEINALADYARYTARLRAVMGEHITALLRAGTSVVLDFPANTLATRQWMRSIIDASGAAHTLHWLDLDDATCKARLRRRNAAGEHAYQAGEAEFELFSRHFVPPAAAEGFVLLVHQAGGKPEGEIPGR